MSLVNGRILLNCIQEKHVLAGAFNTTNPRQQFPFLMQ